MINPDSLRDMPPPSQAPRTQPHDLRYVLEVGYRPFFAVAALTGAWAMTLWAFTLAGVASGERALPALAWHAHEMLWGYGGAVLVGFLFTAVRNWTRQSTPAGAWLAVAAVAWLLIRAAMVLPAGLYPAVALELVAWSIVVVGVARPILRARNTRNYSVLGLTAIFGASDLLGHVPALTATAQAVGLSAMTTLLVLVGGRIIPFFTSAGVGSRPRSYVRLEQIIWPLTLSAELAFGLQRSGYVPSALLALLAGGAALAHGWRLYGWWDRRLLAVPLLWVLHAGYALITLHFALAPWVDLGPWVYSAALHTLTAGAMGLLTIGMLVRVSLGHGGRPLHVGRVTQSMFVLLTLAALTRIVAPVLGHALPGTVAPSMVAAAILWIAAFVIYLWLYMPILLRAGRGPVE